MMASPVSRRWTPFTQIAANSTITETDYVLVLEDDVQFVPEFNKQMRILDQELNDLNWDIVFLGSSDDTPRMYNDEEVSSWAPKNAFTLFQLTQEARSHASGTYGYLLKKSGAMKLQEIIEKG